MTLLEELQFAERRLELARYDVQFARSEGDEPGLAESRRKYKCLDEMMALILRHMTVEEQNTYYFGTTLSLGVA